MNGDPQNVVTYSDNGSLLNRTGNFVVPSFNMNEYKEYQNFGFLQRQKKYLAELIQITLEISL